MTLDNMRALGFIAPCLPTNGRTVPTGLQWAQEIKAVKVVTV
jgi:hypothetical protein